MISLQLAITIAAVCLVCEAFFSGSEMAVVSANRALLRRKAADGNEGARIALDFLTRPQRLLATTLIGTNVSVVIATTVMTLAILERVPRHGEAIAVLILSPTLLIFAEVVPKTFFQQHADKLVTRLVYPLRFFSVVMWPAVALVGRVTALVARVFRVEETRAMVTRDELRLLLDDTEGQASTIPEGEREMITNVLDLGDTTVYDVMVPLSEVTALPEDATLEEAATEIADKQHTRIPIYRERVDQIVGVLFAFDVLAAEAAGKKGTVAELARSPIYVPEAKPTGDLLVELQRSGEHLSVVVDEYGGAVGICTVEDILEEIVGEIDDEYDRGPSTIRSEGPGLWRVLARTPISEVNEAIGIELPEGEDFESIAGLVLDRLKRIPKEGDTIRIGEVTITILGSTERAIEEVRIRVARRK
jgi:CBS domain containing-hemolysin-like protein